MFAVGNVVGVHDGADLSGFDGSLKDGHVNLAKGALVDDGIGVVAEVLGVVAEVVLYRCGDALPLHAADIPDRDAAGQEGIFAEVLEVAPVHRCPVDVYTGAKKKGCTSGT